MRITQNDFKSTSFQKMIHSESLVISIHLYNMGMSNVKWLVGQLPYFIFFLSSQSFWVIGWINLVVQLSKFIFIDFTK